MLLELPTEITLQVLHFADHITLGNCRVVCRALRDAIDNTGTLLHKMMLEPTNMVDGSDSRCSLTERMQRLKPYDKARRALQWSSETHVPFGGRLWDIAGNVVACTDATSPTINFVQLPSTLRGIEEKRWSTPSSQLLCDFTFDPSQDLLVIISARKRTIYEVHLLSMSTGEQHPFAQVSPLVHTVRHPPVQFELLVFGDKLGVLFVSNEEVSVFAVWNWRTNEQYEAPFANDFITSACFLDANTVMATAYTHQVTAPNNVYLKVVDISTPARPTPLCHLHFPTMHTSTDAMADITWDLPPTWENGAPPGYFAPSPTQRILGVSISAWTIEGNVIAGAAARRVPLMLIVSVPAVLAQLPPRTTASFPVSISWAEWGPPATRIFDHEFSPVWVCYIRGLRYVAIDLNANVPSTYSVFDFSDAGASAAAKSEQRSVYHNDNVFSEDVETFLPCHEARGTIPRRPELPLLSYAMLADDGIVFVPHEGQGFWAWTV